MIFTLVLERDSVTRKGCRLALTINFTFLPTPKRATIFKNDDPKVAVSRDFLAFFISLIQLIWAANKQAKTFFLKIKN